MDDPRDRTSYLQNLRKNGLETDWSTNDFDNLNPYDPSPSGFVNSSKFEGNIGYPPDNDDLKGIVNEILVSGEDKLGELTETAMDVVMNDAGYVRLDGKVGGGSDNGFDGLYIKESPDNITEIVIGEAKQWRQPSGGVDLSSGNSSSGLPPQMSKEWINNVISRMRNEGNDELADLLEDNESLIQKQVFAVDKESGEIHIGKLK